MLRNVQLPLDLPVPIRRPHPITFLTGDSMHPLVGISFAEMVSNPNFACIPPLPEPEKLGPPTMKQVTPKKEEPKGKRESHHKKSRNSRQRGQSWCVPSLEGDPVQRSRSISEQHFDENPVCCFCSARGLDPTGHTNKKCPELARMRPCMTCGASGFDNHTLKYCPFRSSSDDSCENDNDEQEYRLVK